MSGIFLFSLSIAPQWCRDESTCPELQVKNKQLTKQHRRNQMKFNKWTLGLAAVGVVSLASAARADEKVSQLNTALSNTTLSGYVDVGVQYVSAAGAAYGAPEAAAPNAFSLNVVDIALDKPLDATPFSAGYHVELWTGATTG